MKTPLRGVFDSNNNHFKGADDRSNLFPNPNRHEIRNRDEEIIRRKYFDTGLKLAENYNPIINRVIRFYSDILPVPYKTSQGNIEYSTFHPDTDLFNNKRIYSWVLFGIPSGESYPPPLLEIELSCMPTGEHYLVVCFWRADEHRSHRVVFLSKSSSVLEDVFDDKPLLDRSILPTRPFGFRKPGRSYYVRPACAITRE